MINLTKLQSFVNNPEKDTSEVSKWLGIKFTKIIRGEIFLEFTIQEKHCNIINVPHGGILCSVLDEAMGLLAYTLDLPDNYVTSNLTIDFLNGPKIGQTLIANAQIIKEGRRIIYVESSLYHNNKLIVRGRCSLMKRK